MTSLSFNCNFAVKCMDFTHLVKQLHPVMWEEISSSSNRWDFSSSEVHHTCVSDSAVVWFRLSADLVRHSKCDLSCCTMILIKLSNLTHLFAWKMSDWFIYCRALWVNVFINQRPGCVFVCLCYFDLLQTRCWRRPCTSVSWSLWRVWSRRLYTTSRWETGRTLLSGCDVSLLSSVTLGLFTISKFPVKLYLNVLKMNRSFTHIDNIYQYISTISK